MMLGACLLFLHGYYEICCEAHADLLLTIFGGMRVLVYFGSSLN